MLDILLCNFHIMSGTFCIIILSNCFPHLHIHFSFCPFAYHFTNHLEFWTVSSTSFLLISYCCSYSSPLSFFFLHVSSTSAVSLCNWLVLPLTVSFFFLLDLGLFTRVHYLSYVSLLIALQMLPWFPFLFFYIIFY